MLALQLLGYDNGKRTNPMLPRQTPMRQTSSQCGFAKPLRVISLILPHRRYASVQVSWKIYLVNIGQSCRCHGRRRHSQGNIFLSHQSTVETVFHCHPVQLIHPCDSE